MERSDIDRMREDPDLLNEVVMSVCEGKFRRGEFWCPCPLHGERTASFHTRHKTARWKCFGCGKGGDVFAFVMEHQRVGFVQAVEIVAGIAARPLTRRAAPKLPPPADPRIVRDVAARYPSRPMYDYEDMVVFRIDKPEGKEFSQWRKVPGGYVVGRTNNTPLYRRPRWHGTNGILWVVEGEKCVHALEELGMLTTTSCGGAFAPDKSDWSTVLGRDIVLWPDGDKAGETYRRWIVRYLRGKASTGRLWVMDPVALDLEGGDVDDWLEREGRGVASLVTAAREGAVQVQVRHEGLDGVPLAELVVR